MRTDPKEVGERIEAYRKNVLEASREVFSTRLGVHPNTLARYERGERYPDTEFLLKLNEVFGISPEWVLTGAPIKTRHEKVLGEEFEAAAIALEAQELRQAMEMHDHVGGEFALIPRYSVEARAGHGAAVEHEQVVGRFAFRRDWLAAAGLREKNLALITARGDSMEPTISDGDVLLIDTGVHQVDEDGVYAVRLNGHLAVKRLQRIGAGRVRVISDNSAYATYDIDLSVDETLDPDRLTIVGRVVWSGGLL